MKCSFCEKDMPRGTGKTVVKKDNTVVFLCSRKCEKNLMHLKRNPVRVGWTGKFAREKEARIAAKGKE